MPNKRQTFDYEPVTRSRRERSRTGDAPSAADWSSPGKGSTTGGAAHGAAQQLPPPASSPLVLNSESWMIKRGHALSYVGLFLYTVVLYFRPTDYYLAYATFPLAQILAVLTLLAFLPAQLASENTLTARPREVNLALLLCLTALLSIPLAVSPSEAWDTFSGLFIKSVIMFVVIVNVVRTERRLKWMLLLALTVSCTLGVSALNDYRLGNVAVEGYRVTGEGYGSFGNTNDMAIHLVTMFPIAIGLALSTRGVLGKLSYGFCATLILASIVVTFSRGAFLGLMAVGFVTAWKLGRRNRPVVLGALIFAVLLFLAVAPGSYWLRIASIFDPSLDPVGSSSARSALLKRSVVITLANPLFGIGMGNFHIVSIREQVSHNSYTQAAAEMGLAAAVIYTMFIIAPLRRLREIERETFAARRGSRFYYLAVMLQASLVGYMVSSNFASVAYYWFIYYLVGYAVCLRRVYAVMRDNEEAAVNTEAGRRGLAAEAAAPLLAQPKIALGR